MEDKPAMPQRCSDNDPERDCKCGGQRGKPSCMFPDAPVAQPSTRVTKEETKMWTLESSLVFIRKLIPIAEAYGWNLLLDGSILSKGYSDKDLDIVALSRNRLNFPPNREDLLTYLNNAGWTFVKKMQFPDRVTYVLVNKEEKRIDLCFVDLTKRS